MQIELLGLLGVFDLILFAFSEFSRRREIGVIASLLLLIMGFIIVIDGIQFVTGTTVIAGGCI